MNNTDNAVQERDSPLDRKWNELLQEMRVMQTGAQILAAFLVVLPFQSRFEMLEEPEKIFYIILLVCSALLIIALVIPVSVHRHFFGRDLKATTVHIGDIIARIVVLGVGFLVPGCVWFVVHVLEGWKIGIAVGGTLMLIAMFLLIFLPRIITPRTSIPSATNRREE